MTVFILLWTLTFYLVAYAILGLLVFIAILRFRIGAFFLLVFLVLGLINGVVYGSIVGKSIEYSESSVMKYVIG